MSLARVTVQAEPAYRAQALEWAERLGLPFDEASAEFILLLDEQGLKLQERSAQGGMGPIHVDFLAGASAHRRRFGGGQGQMIAKAVGVQPGIRPQVLDATAGLGRDAFVLASLGCEVRMIERQPVVAALLEDGLQRARQDAEVAAIVARMHLQVGCAIAAMAAWSGDAPPQVIYLDPMFPHRDKSALVKKEMRLFRPLVGADDDAAQLLEAALALASHRVVVKRPRKAPAVEGSTPGYALEGKSSRYDIYPLRKITALSAV